MGVAADRLHVTGTMKWDTAEIADRVEGAEELADAMGIDRSRPLVVAGSTAPGEHELLERCLNDGVQLLCAPRRPEWFDQAAAAMPGCVRRSRGDRGSETGRFLLDTIGELRQAYALADVVVVGRSFGNLHGSDMMEPIALGAAVVTGPAVEDFQDTVDALLAGDGLVQTNREGLAKVLSDLLGDPQRRKALAENGRTVLRQQQGATARNAELIRKAIRH
jgi:3-deoxy-D-manno-octulosonic-acid transferase